MRLRSYSRPQPRNSSLSRQRRFAITENSRSRCLAVPRQSLCTPCWQDPHSPGTRFFSFGVMNATSRRTISKVPVPPENIFRVRAEEKDANVVAKDYEEALKLFFRLKPGEFPRFDLILLGLGPDGHTASLFPNTAALNETKRLVVANWVEKFKANRITFTYPVLNNAACVIFLVSGADKADMVRTV